MATNTISQRIALEGAEEIKRQLKEIANTAGTSFDDIVAHSVKATEGLSKHVKSVEAVERSYAKLQGSIKIFGASFGELRKSYGDFETALNRTIASVTKYTLAITAAVGGVSAFVVAGIKAGDAIEEQASAAGLSAQRFQELGFAAASAGVKATQFSNAMQKFSQVLEKDVAKSNQTLLKFLDNQEFDDWGGRIKEVGNRSTATFKTIQDGVKALQARIAEAGGKAPPFPKLFDDLSKLAFGTAKARQEFEELTGITLPRSADGLDDFRFKVQGAEDGMRALGLQVKKDAEGNIDLSANIDQVADAFQKMPDGTRKSAIALALFGKSGKALIPFLNEGSKGIADLTAEGRKLGIFLDKESIALSAKASNAFDLLGQAAVNVRNQIGAALAPSAEAIAGGLVKIIQQNQAAINKFANDLNAKLIPKIQAFFDFLSGKSQTTGDSEFLKQLQGIEKAAIKTGEIVAAVAKGILFVLDLIAAGINKVFGTELDGKVLAAILIIGKLTGAFVLLGASLKLISNIVKVFVQGLVVILRSGGLLVNVLRAVGIGLAALVGWPALIVAGIAAAIVAIIVFWDQIKAAGVAAWDAVVAATKAAWEFIKSIFTESIPNAWEWIKDAASSVWEGVKTIATTVWEGLKFIFLQAIPGAFRWMAEAFLAVTGAIRDAFTTLMTWIGQQLLKVADVVAKLFAAGTKAKELANLQTSDTGVVQAQTTGEEVAATAGQEKPKAPVKDKVALEAIAREIEKINGLIEGVLTKVNEFNATVIETLTSTFTEFTATIQSLVEALVENIQTTVERLGEAIQQPFITAAEGIGEALSGINDLITETFASLNQVVEAAAATVESAIAKIIAQLEAAVAKAVALAETAAAAAAAAGGGGGGGGGGDDGGDAGFARGGYVRGPGTATSDSIRAWLSDGEFVQPTRAVNRYGADLFEAFRRGRVSVDAARSLLGGRRFNLGGLVSDMFTPLSVPRFAAGGMVDATGGQASPTSSFTLQLPNGQQHQLTGSRSAVTSIHDWAKFSILASAGKRAR